MKTFQMLRKRLLEKRNNVSSLLDYSNSVFKPQFEEMDYYYNTIIGIIEEQRKNDFEQLAQLQAKVPFKRFRTIKSQRS